MQERHEAIISKYYDNAIPCEIKEVQVLSESPESGVTCIRWKKGRSTVTVKAIGHGDTIILTQLK
jgi:hypothetical protein